MSARPIRVGNLIELGRPGATVEAFVLRVRDLGDHLEFKVAWWEGKQRYEQWVMDFEVVNVIDFKPHTACA
jgi:hypothetical protein